MFIVETQEFNSYKVSPPNSEYTNQLQHGYFAYSPVLLWLRFESIEQSLYFFRNTIFNRALNLNNILDRQSHICHLFVLPLSMMAKYLITIILKRTHT